MVVFHSFLYVYQRVTITNPSQPHVTNIPVDRSTSQGQPMEFPQRRRRHRLTPQDRALHDGVRQRCRKPGWWCGLTNKCCVSCVCVWVVFIMLDIEILKFQDLGWFLIETIMLKVCWNLLKLGWSLTEATWNGEGLMLWGVVPLPIICGNEVVRSDFLVVDKYDQPVAVVIFVSQTIPINWPCHGPDLLQP